MGVSRYTEEDYQAIMSDLNNLLGIGPRDSGEYVAPSEGDGN